MITLNGPDVCLKHVHFPFADRHYELERVIKGRCKNVPPEIIHLIQTFKPYRNGNDLLWALINFPQPTGIGGCWHWVQEPI